MSTVDISTRLPGATKLWRYLSLDKFVDLLSTEELFFTPLARFIASDPFEGYLPSVAMTALAKIFKNSIGDLTSSMANLEEHLKKTNPQLVESAMQEPRKKLEDLKAAPKQFYLPIIRCQTVNCWHANEGESEAMWRLYSENGKAVAVETTVDALCESIRSRPSEHCVHIYPVKYLDFFDTSLEPKDCTVEGRHLTPLLKRRCYEHENEVRAFIGRSPKSVEESTKMDTWQPIPIRLPVDVQTLVRRVHVSPYAGEPFPSSVVKVSEALGLPKHSVVPSRLLSGHEELLNLLKS